MTRASRWRASLIAHREVLTPLLRKRTPKDLTDGSDTAETFKRLVRAWNADALRLLEASPAGATQAAAFRVLGRMRYTTLADVRGQLRERARLLDEALGGSAHSKGKGKSDGKSKGRTKQPQAGRVKGGARIGTFDYDVCLSFAGENRPYVEQVAGGLKAAGVRVFYDRDVEADLWGEDLYVYLDDLYRNRARYCVMFISRHYAKKLWTNHERQSAQARAFEENRAYILPARFDDTVIVGVRPTIGYIDLRRRKPAVVVTTVLQKLGYNVPAQSHGSRAQSSTAPQPGQPKTNRRAVKRSVASVGNLALLGEHFYTVQNVRRQGNTVQVDVRARNAREAADLRRLDPHGGTLRATRIRFAHLTDAGWARVTSVASAASGKAMFTVNLDIESLTSRSAVAALGVASCEVAEHQARQVLLGESPPMTGNRMFVGPIDSTVSDGVLVLAVQGRHTTEAALLQRAWLLAVFYLKTLHIVDDVLELQFNLKSSGLVRIHLKGRIESPYSSQPANEFTTTGEVTIPTTVTR